MSYSVLPWVCPVWNSLSFLDLGGYFPAHFREVFNYYLFKYFLMPFLFLFFSGTPVIRMLGCFTLSQKSLRLSSFLLIVFSSLLHLFPPFYTSLILLLPVILLLAPSRVLLISLIALFIIDLFLLLPLGPC